MKNNPIPAVYLIILNYNSGEWLSRCLTSVFKSDYPNYEVVVVDNASTDGSFEAAKNGFSRAHFIKSHTNLGFSAGNNLGIRLALEKMADYVFLLNPDALVDPETVSILVAAAEENKTAGIFSPLVFQGATQNIWFAGGIIHWLRMRATHLFKRKTFHQPYPTEYISGCAMLIRDKVFQRIGLLSEDFFLYYEDADFSLRATRAGFTLLVVPSASVHHFEKSQLNAPLKTYWLIFSGLIFFQKHTPLFFRPWMHFFIVLRRIKNWRVARKNKNSLAPIIKKSFTDYSQWKKTHSSHS